jgi:hypothetical protein
LRAAATARSAFVLGVEDAAPVGAGGIDPGAADENLAALDAEILWLPDVHVSLASLVTGPW